MCSIGSGLYLTGCIEMLSDQLEPQCGFIAKEAWPSPFAAFASCVLFCIEALHTAWRTVTMA